MRKMELEKAKVLSQGTQQLSSTIKHPANYLDTLLLLLHLSIPPSPERQKDRKEEEMNFYTHLWEILP